MCSGRVHEAHRLQAAVERQRAAQSPAVERFFGRHEARQIGGERVVEPLVGVDAEHPGLARLFEGELLLPRVAEPVLMDKPDRQAAADEVLDDGERAVGRARIDDDDLGEPCKAGEALADAGFLVLADDGRGDRQRVGPGRVRGHAG